MPEILTESFCERCGTRYTFESAAPAKARKLGRFKTLSKGLKNYVLSDDTSMDEAMAAARSDEEREVTSHQLDAFHATFNFCMTCRQYTCGNCWNQVEGQCLTCAPHLGHEIMPAPFPDLVPAPFLDLTPMAAEETVHVEASAWPVSDLQPETLEPPDDGDGFDVAARLARLSGFPMETEPETADAVAAEQVAAPPVAEQAVDTSVGAWPVEAAESAEAAAATLDVADEPEIAVEPAAEAVVADDDQNAAPAAAAAEEFVQADEFVAAEELVAAEAAEAYAAEELVAAAEPEPDELVAASPPDVAAEPVPEPMAAEAFPQAVDDRAAVAARRTADLLAKFRPGQNIDDALAAYEAAVAAPVEEPVADLAAAPATEPEAAPEFEPVVAAEAEPVEAEPVEAAPVEAAPAEVAAVDLAPEPVAEVMVEATVEPVAAMAEAPAEVAAEVAEGAAPEIAAAAPEVAAEAAPEEVAEEALPEVAAAAPEIAAEPPAAPPAPEPVRADRVEQPTWRIVAPDVPAPVTNGHGPEGDSLPAAASATPPAPAPSAEPQWPSAPEWPGAQPPAPFMADRRTSTSAATEALWAASARDVVTPPAGAPSPGVQSCSSCGLSLSATARFCRRCGTRQGA